MRSDDLNINEKTYLFWIDIKLGIPPFCGGTYGEWHMNNDIRKLYEDFKNVIYDIVSIICHDKGYAFKDNPIKTLSDFKDDYEFDIEDIESYDKLINSLYDLNISKQYLEFKEYSSSIFLMFNNLGINCNFYLFDSLNEALDLVKKHNNVIITDDYNQVFQNDIMEG